MRIFVFYLHWHNLHEVVEIHGYGNALKNSVRTYQDLGGRGGPDPPLYLGFFLHVLAPYDFPMKNVAVVFPRARLNLRVVALVHINGVSSLMSSTRARIEGSDIHLPGVERNQNAVAFPDNLHSHK
jgi:hypothetical protein